MINLANNGRLLIFCSIGRYDSNFLCFIFPISNSYLNGPVENSITVSDCVPLLFMNCFSRSELVIYNKTKYRKKSYGYQRISNVSQSLLL